MCQPLFAKQGHGAIERLKQGGLSEQIQVEAEGVLAVCFLGGPVEGTEVIIQAFPFVLIQLQRDFLLVFVCV